MKKISLFLLTAITLLLSATPAHAVTKEEMEQAKTTAAKWYLRYANNMSAYLDDINPRTMQELESQLKDTEKENLKDFTAISVPTDYASWDKDKLVSYWGGDFFKSPGLKAKGADCYNRVKGAIKEMKVTAPGEAPAATPAAENPVATTADNGQTPVALTDGQVADSGLEESDTESALEREEGTSNTIIYIIILAILIIVVIALVVYASKKMKSNDNSAKPKQRRNPDDYPSAIPTAIRQEAPAQPRTQSQPERREGFSASRAAQRETIGDTRQRRLEREMSERDAEIRRLQGDLKMVRSDLRQSEAQLDETTRLLNEARDENRRLYAEIDRLKKSDSEATVVTPHRTSFHHAHSTQEERTTVDVPAAEAPVAEAAKPEPVKPEPIKTDNTIYQPKPKEEPKPVEENREASNQHRFMPKSSTPAAERTIFLGRVNSKGIFVRADRNFNPGNSYYRLVTSNGTSGTFTVINDPSVWDLALISPDDVLFNACTGPQIDQSFGRNEIITEQPGTAIFDDGAWRVTRKAQIKYL